jgi:hypothetical protein
MNTESDTPRTDEMRQAYVNFQHGKYTVDVGDVFDFARKLERELNETMAALRNLTHEIGRHESASMMHPRLTRAISAANRLTNEKKEQEKSIDT